MVVMPNLDRTLQGLLEKDKQHLASTDLPIITVSASFKEDLKGWYGLPEDETVPDVVLSRAHYSMALAIAKQAWGIRHTASLEAPTTAEISELRKHKAWIFDPTNYVSQSDWKKVLITEQVGKTLARHPTLKTFKDFIDKWGRNKLPILSSIQPSLVHVAQDLQHPILSLHIAAGNILAQSGKTVLQVITDPHIRSDYLINSERSNMFFCVFDHKTKTDFLEKAALAGKTVDPARVTVTGPPIDPQVHACRLQKRIWHPTSGAPLRLCITTGGLGTNKIEIETLLRQLLPAIKADPTWLQLLVYTSTQKDIYYLVQELASEYQINPGASVETESSLRVLYHPQIVDANQLLLTYGFPWADGFITKPSGDMAYDAVASGSFVLSLQEWGEWEINIKNIFEQREISRRAQPAQIVEQLRALSQRQTPHGAWITQAMQKTRALPPLFTAGAQNIVRTYHDLKRK